MFWREQAQILGWIKPFAQVKNTRYSPKEMTIEWFVDTWHGQARTILGDWERFLKTYFSTFPGYYFTGDGARRDAYGYYWITGRLDDVINISGHRLGTVEVEYALASHPSVAEAAVVGMPHEIRDRASSLS